MVKRSGSMRASVAALSLVLASCGGGGSSGGGSTPTPSPSPTPSPTPTQLDKYVAPAQESLTSADVETIIGQAVSEAQARSLPAVIAVTDRVGNVLAIYSMAGAAATATTSAAPDGNNIDAQNLTVPAAAGAIAKAITGAYLSSGGNAFTTRTASQIVQEHFPPAPGLTNGLESGPLFGVQFSQLPCSDLNTRVGVGSPMIGPRRSPLGLAADPGGFPIYKNGTLVGGIGVMADGVYGFDPDSISQDVDLREESIALAGTHGFEASGALITEGDIYILTKINVDGTTLKYSEALSRDLMSSSAASLSTANLTSVTGYYDAADGFKAGAAYGSEASGYRASTAAEFSIRDAFVLTDGTGANRFPIRAGTDAGDVATPLSSTEVTAILEEAFTIMTRARAQIRQPLDSRAQVTISMVDSRGQVLGIVRSPDAPIFGTDVSLQKARTATFFSHAQASTELTAFDSGIASNTADVRAFVGAVRSFLNDATALTGTFAFADRSGGNLSRPFFPDGEVGRPHGPLSRPIEQFNPFSTGLQSALILGNLAQHLAFVTGASPTDTPQRCTFTPDVATDTKRLNNGIQIFPGSVPIYRGNELVGGIGVSGDGIDQDDMISFLGLHFGGLRTADVQNAPAAIRADQIVVDLGGSNEARLRYVSCPFAPFLDTPENNVCEGL